MGIELTRDQILAMPAGRELDKLVAEHVFKAKVITKEINNVTFYKVVDDNNKPLRVTLWDLSTEWAWDNGCPLYSEDIAAAWEVVEQMHKLNWWTVINYQYGEKNAFFYWDPHQKGIDVSAETIPLAICRASLLAVMGL